MRLFKRRTKAKKGDGGDCDPVLKDIANAINGGGQASLAWFDEDVFEGKVRYYEAWIAIAGNDYPKITVVAMKLRSGSGEHQNVMAWVGPSSEIDKQQEPSEEEFAKLLPPEVLAVINLPAYGCSNYALPGCHLTSTETFDGIINDIDAGRYDLVQVLAVDGKPPNGSAEAMPPNEMENVATTADSSDTSAVTVPDAVDSKPTEPAGAADNAKPSQDRIKVECQCGAKLHAKPELVGKQRKCPKCGEPVLIVAKPAEESVAAQVVRKCGSCGYIEECDYTIKAKIPADDQQDGEPPPGAAIECCKCSSSGTAMYWQTPNGELFDRVVSLEVG